MYTKICLFLLLFRFHSQLFEVDHPYPKPILETISYNILVHTSSFYITRNLIRLPFFRFPSPSTTLYVHFHNHSYRHGLSLLMACAFLILSTIEITLICKSYSFVFYCFFLVAPLIHNNVLNSTTCILCSSFFNYHRFHYLYKRFPF